MNQLYHLLPYTVPCIRTRIRSLINLQQGLRLHLQYPAKRGHHTDLGEVVVLLFIIKCTTRVNKIVSEMKYDPFQILGQERKRMFLCLQKQNWEQLSIEWIKENKECVSSCVVLPSFSPASFRRSLWMSITYFIDRRLQEFVLQVNTFLF